MNIPSKIQLDFFDQRTPEQLNKKMEIIMNTSKVGNSDSCLKIYETSALKFCGKVEALLLDPPEWAFLHVGTVRTYLDGMPTKLTNYTYAPKSNHNGLVIKFKCTEKSFKLTLKKEQASFGFAQILQNNSSNLDAGRNIQGLIHPTRSPKTKLDNEIIYHGALTSESVNQFPVHLQGHAKKLSESDFPYTTKVKSNGDVIVGGSVSFVGRTVSLADLMKEMGINEKK